MQNMLTENTLFNLKCKHYNLPMVAHNSATFRTLNWKFAIKIALKT